LSNGDTLNPKLSSDSNTIANMIKTGEENESIVRQIFIAALSREPTEEEFQTIMSVIEEYGEERATALQDAAWSILASTEFTFNH
jgi:hypothetical protein